MQGRPSIYSDDLSAVMCIRISEGESVNSICRDEDMPSKATFFSWLNTNKSFLDNYTRAKQLGAEAIAEDMFEIADDGTNDWMEKLDKDGKASSYQLNGEHVQRSKLRVDTRKWYLSKILPKKYGDKINVEGNLNHRDATGMSDAELERIAAGSGEGAT